MTQNGHTTLQSIKNTKQIEQVQTNATNIGENTVKIKELCETTAGAVATVAAPVGGMISRQMKNPDGTAKNALDVDTNILGGKAKKKKAKSSKDKQYSNYYWSIIMTEKATKESGLQRHIGIKKYGKKGFEELQKAGREGASEEEKGAIKDKHLTKKESEDL